LRRGLGARLAVAPAELELAVDLAAKKLLSSSQLSKTKSLPAAALRLDAAQKNVHSK